jgi:hypothetical protein
LIIYVEASSADQYVSECNQFDFTGFKILCFRVANHKLLECEIVCLQLAFLQLAALKSLATLLSCGRYSELLLVPNAVSQKSSDGPDKDKV